MKFEVKSLLMRHRGERCLRSVAVEDADSNGIIDSVPFMIGAVGSKFWLVPIREKDEPFVKDIGPFDTFEQAYAQLRLRGK